MSYAPMVERIAGDPGEWLKQVRLKVAGPGEAYLLLQGSPYTGLACVHEDGLGLPPEHPAVANGFDAEWDIFWDLRLFGAQGEYHAWRQDGGWHCRFAPKEQHNSVERDYPLWGRNDEGPNATDWDCYHETRGARIFVPSKLTSGLRFARMRILQVIDFDESGMAGVVDAMILGIKGFQAEEASS